MTAPDDSIVPARPGDAREAWPLAELEARLRAFTGAPEVDLPLRVARVQRAQQRAITIDRIRRARAEEAAR